MHKVTVGEGELRTGQTVQAVVDGDWRLGACQAHSATHVIHEALHEILGPDRAAGAARSTGPATCDSTSAGTTG